LLKCYAFIWWGAGDQIRIGKFENVGMREFENEQEMTIDPC
jgi:hypothetical protein